MNTTKAACCMRTDNGWLLQLLMGGPYMMPYRGNIGGVVGVWL